MNFTPYDVDEPSKIRRVFIRRHLPEDLTAGGIHIPEKAQKEIPFGTITHSKVDSLPVGAEVIFDAFGGREFEVNREKFLVLDVSEILAVNLVPVYKENGDE